MSRPIRATPTTTPAATLAELLTRRGVIGEARCKALAATQSTPWWLAGLLALAAWVASLTIMASFFGPLLALGDGPATRALGGLVLLGLALYLFRSPGPFLQQMALAFSLAGQGLLASGVLGDASWMHSNDALAGAVLIIALAMQVPRSSSAHRTVCALIALTALGYLIGPGTALVFYGIVLAALAGALWLGRAHWAGQAGAGHLKALAHAATLSALALAVYGSPAMTLFLDRSFGGFPPYLYPLGAALVLLATVAWLSRQVPGSPRLLLLAGGLAFALLAREAPGLLVATGLLLACYQAGQRVWVGLTLVCSALYLGELYYSLNATLLAKSLALMASGALLLGVRLALALKEKTP